MTPMNRRGFLKLLGAAATLAAVPDLLGSGRTFAHAPFAAGKRCLVFDCGPLEAGKSYTFSCFVKGASLTRVGANGRIEEMGNGWKGLYVTGVVAKGGETAIVIPIDDDDDTMHEPVLSKEGVTMRPASLDFTRGPAHPADVSRGNDVLVSHVQLEVGQRATPYIQTTSRRR